MTDFKHKSKKCFTKKLETWCRKHKPTSRSLRDLLLILRDERMAKPSNSASFIPGQNALTVEEPINKYFENLKSEIVRQNDIVQESLARHKKLVESLVRKDQHLESISEDLFPIDSDEKLSAVEKEILDGNGDQVLAALKYKFEKGVDQTLTSVLSENIILEYNVLGIHGKKTLKGLRFYDLLMVAINAVHKDGKADAHLRKAMKYFKLKHLKSLHLNENESYKSFGVDNDENTSLGCSDNRNNDSMELKLADNDPISSIVIDNVEKLKYEDYNETGTDSFGCDNYPNTSFGCIDEDNEEHEYSNTANNSFGCDYQRKTSFGCSDSGHKDEEYGFEKSDNGAFG